MISRTEANSDERWYGGHSLRHYSEIRCHARFSLERDHVAKRLIQT